MVRLSIFLKQYLITKYRRQFPSREALEQWQKKQVHTFLQQIVPQSPFYAQLYDQHSLATWEELPIIDKEVMMEHFNQLNTKGIIREEAFQFALEAEKSRNFTTKLKQVTIGLSSGTSGNRGLFLVSDQEQIRWAAAMIAKVLTEPIWKKQQVALFLRANSNLYTSLQRGPIQFQFFDMIQPLTEHLVPLSDYQPTILIAPPSYLRFLAEEMIQGRLSIQPKKVISVAEVLEPLDQKVIEEAFQQTIHQIYQATEGFLGVTCEHGTIHLNEDLIAIQKEYLDEAKQRFSPIITDFSRTTQPILRYRLNDILTERSDSCPCGSPMLAVQKIEGRCDDILPFPTNNRNYRMIFPDFIRRALITASTDILEYLVIQHSPTQLEISIRTDSGKADETSRAVVQAIRQLCHEQQCQIPDILFTPYRRTPSINKLRRVERRFPLPDPNQNTRSFDFH
ncbi:putative adenylate-forming enzyme [Seinonella peptonophila]|uniref:Putative adenylate-forming enzyme n=1 Tax=Seinonella peptonophila TaxID=112248 RepID=A0A1M4WHM4_9BACL|nr:F390 synthetase-related protein [Seinonella peptonophila]SHE80739.1 putative adenylate-forming enzyme [Seinonella peptonophila]